MYASEFRLPIPLTLRHPLYKQDWSGRGASNALCRLAYTRLVKNRALRTRTCHNAAGQNPLDTIRSQAQSTIVRGPKTPEQPRFKAWERLQGALPEATMSKTAAESDLEAGFGNGHAAKKAKLQLSKNHSVALVLDYGSQYTQLIGRRIREAGVYSMLKPADATLVSQQTKLGKTINHSACKAS